MICSRILQGCAGALGLSALAFAALTATVMFAAAKPLGERTYLQAKICL
jgi:hypothetical protein